MSDIENRKPKRRNNSLFNTLLFVILAVVVIFLLVKGFIWAWNTMGAWDTL